MKMKNLEGVVSSDPRSMRLHVLVVIGGFPPDHGGGSLRIQQTYELMACSEVTYEVLTHAPRTEVRAGESARVRRLPREASSIRLAWSVFEHIRRGRDRIDLVHVVGADRLMFIACWVCRLLGVPYVTELVMDPPVRERSRFSPRGWIERVGKLPYYRADGSVAMTQRIADHFLGRGSSPKRVFLRANPCTIDVRGDTPRDARAGGILEGLDTPYRYLMIGRLCPRKGHEYALAVLAKLPEDHGLAIAGPVLDEADRRHVAGLRSKAERLGLGGRLLLHTGYLRSPGESLCAADALWMLSEKEGYPNVVLEALWLGTRVVAGAWLGLHVAPYDLADGGLVVGRDPAQAAAEILAWISSPAPSAAIAARARRQFDPVVHARATSTFLRTVADLRRNGAPPAASCATSSS